jgi:hypothetical protein
MSVLMPRPYGGKPKYVQSLIQHFVFRLVDSLIDLSDEDDLFDVDYVTIMIHKRVFHPLVNTIVIYHVKIHQISVISTVGNELIASQTYSSDKFQEPVSCMCKLLQSYQCDVTFPDVTYGSISSFYYPKTSPESRLRKMEAFITREVDVANVIEDYGNDSVIEL